MNTTIILQGDDIRVWALVNVLKDLGVFNIKFGSVKIDFDGEKRINNIQITTNHRSPELST